MKPETIKLDKSALTGELFYAAFNSKAVAVATEGKALSKSNYLSI